jgi:hypothetical protein
MNNEPLHTAEMLRKLRRRYAGRDGDTLFFEVSPGVVEGVERSRLRAWAERGWETRQRHKGGLYYGGGVAAVKLRAAR